MENIHKFVSDPEHKKMLREGDGIGTSATRASIISELKRREFLETKGKQIVSTTLGRSVIDALPEVVRSPVLTALYDAC
jgi:DNA topoisomerase-3